MLEEFAYSPACVFAFVLEKQKKANKHRKYSGFKQEGNIIWCNFYRVHAISSKCHFLGWPDYFTCYNEEGVWGLTDFSEVNTDGAYGLSCWIT